MKITLLVVGESANPHLTAVQEDYQRRLEHYAPFDIQTLPEPRNTRGLSAEQQKRLEGERILKSVQPTDFVALLDERGKQLRSVELADWLQSRMNSGTKRLVLVVGGPYGFAPEVYARGDYKLSLSSMTFSHQMIRLFIVEQLYRSMTILRGEPYHHE